MNQQTVQAVGLNKMKYLECYGSPHEMGIQYGEQACDEIYHYLKLRSLERLPDTMRPAAAHCRRVLEKYLPAVLDELEGIANGAGIDPDIILLINQFSTSKESQPQECTPIVLRHSSVGPIIAKNNDALPEQHYPFVIRKCEPNNGLPFLHVTYAGWLCGMDAMNAEGLANTHASVGSKFDRSGDRVDIRLRTYALMSVCRSTEEFIQGLSDMPLTGKGFGIAVGDAEGDTAVLDAAVPFVSVRDRGKAFAYSTNLYMAPGFEEADNRPSETRPVCFFRNGYLRWVEEMRPPQNLVDIKALLSSHEPWGPCRHGGPHCSKTVWSMINLPQERKILIADDSPCKSQYSEFNL